MLRYSPRNHPWVKGKPIKINNTENVHKKSTTCSKNFWGDKSQNITVICYEGNKEYRKSTKSWWLEVQRKHFPTLHFFCLGGGLRKTRDTCRQLKLTAVLEFLQFLVVSCNDCKFSILMCSKRKSHWTPTGSDLTSMKMKHTVGMINRWAELLKLNGPLKRAQSSNLQHRHTHPAVPTTKARHVTTLTSSTSHWYTSTGCAHVRTGVEHRGSEFTKVLSNLE